MRATWKRRGDVCRSARLIYWPLCIKMTGQGASLKQAESGSEKYHLCEGCVVLLAYFHPLAGSRRRRGKPRLKSPVTSCDTWWCKDQQWNCLFSSPRLRLHITPGLKRATLHQLAGRQLTFTWRWHSACFLCCFVKKEKSLIRKANYWGRRAQTEGRQQIIRRTEGWLDKQGQTCCLAARRSCSGGGDAGRTWY